MAPILTEDRQRHFANGESLAVKVDEISLPRPMDCSAGDFNAAGLIGRSSFPRAIRQFKGIAGHAIGLVSSIKPTGSGFRWTTALAAGATGLMWNAAAQAGGYVAPIVEFTPPPAVAAALPANYWLALIPLALLAFAGLGGGGDDGMTPLPPDYGGPCFAEGTLIQLEQGWVPVETIRTGDRILTSKGVQVIRSVDSWLPVDYRDRACVLQGVHLSPNHGVASGQFVVPVQEATPTRARIDGSRYFHILVDDHSWLSAKSSPDGTVVQAESLKMTDDLKLAKKFPDLAARHAADPVARFMPTIQETAVPHAA